MANAALEEALDNVDTTADSANTDEIDTSKLDFGDEVEAEGDSGEEQAAADTKEAAEEKPKEKEADAEAKSDEQQATSDEQETDSYMVPKYRLDAKQKRIDTLQQELEQQRRQNQMLAQRVKQENDAMSQEREAQLKQMNESIDELYIKIEDARADGDSKLAARLQRELDDTRTKAQELQRPTLETQSEAPNKQLTVEEFKEQLRFDEVVDGIYADYPMLDEESKDYDQDLVAEVVHTFRGLTEIYPDHQAMAIAAKRVLLDYGLWKENKTEAPQKRSTDVEKNLDAARRTPPDLTSAGRNSDTAGARKRIDINHMTIEQFESLGEEDLADVRGDHAI